MEPQLDILVVDDNSTYLVFSAGPANRTLLNIRLQTLTAGQQAIDYLEAKGNTTTAPGILAGTASFERLRVWDTKHGVPFEEKESVPKPSAWDDFNEPPVQPVEPGLGSRRGWWDVGLRRVWWRAMIESISC